MLKIKKSYRFSKIELPSVSSIMHFSPSTHADDELDNTVAYAYADQHDNNWELTEQPDVNLEQRWAEVVEDARKDPDWMAFSE